MYDCLAPLPPILGLQGKVPRPGGPILTRYDRTQVPGKQQVEEGVDSKECHDGAQGEGVLPDGAPPKACPSFLVSCEEIDCKDKSTGAQQPCQCLQCQRLPRLSLDERVPAHRL